MDQQDVKPPGDAEQSTELLHDATGGLSNLKVKRRSLTFAQRKAAIKAKLDSKGEEFDPAKWRRGQKFKLRKKQKRPVGPQSTAQGQPKKLSVLGEAQGSTALAAESVKRPTGELTTLAAKSVKCPTGKLTTPPSSEGPAKRARGNGTAPYTPTTVPKHRKFSYRDTSATKVAVVLQGFPQVKLTALQGETIEDAVMDELQPQEDGSIPSFAGSYLENGALILCCLSKVTVDWVMALIPNLKPLGEEVNLVVSLRKDFEKTTRIFFRTHPKLNRKSPEKILEMLDALNPTFKVKEWNVPPVKPDPKGYGFVCFLGEACIKAVASANYMANLGLWQVLIATSGSKDHAPGPSDIPPPQ